jgi:predicted Zn finger-like uncharacterized protein
MRKVCPHCKKPSNINSDLSAYAGKTVKATCPRCKNTFSFLVDIGTIIESGPRSATAAEARIEVKASSKTSGQQFPLKVGKNVIGRYAQGMSDSSADIKIKTTDQYMSRVHCCIEKKRLSTGTYEYLLYDLNSLNKTIHNSNKLHPADKIILKNGDEIVLGESTIVFKTISTDDTMVM